MKTEILHSLKVSAWFMILTFPIMVIRVNTIEDEIEWRWLNMILVGVGSFILSFFWRYLLKRTKTKPAPPSTNIRVLSNQAGILGDRRLQQSALIVLLIAAIFFPFVASVYQVNIMITAIMFVVLGLGLNIVVGLAGLLDLGYVAFYAVGAYAYALLNHHYDIGFWIALPIGGILGFLAGVILGFPVLRLRGDYLAIVTLGFGEIIRLVLENWNEFSMGPSGISNIDRPGFWGWNMDFREATIYMYFIVMALCLLTIFVVNRLDKSRLGRAWVALREDEIACQAMGIDKTKTKLAAFALGATWAGMIGVVFAAKTTFINPASFTFMESAIILCIVVLGGMGSILGVILGALILILLPEYLRALSDYRMIVFGACMVLMMVFRPQGLISSPRTQYQFPADKAKKQETPS